MAIMAPGRQSRTLSAHQIARLVDCKNEQRLSLPGLKRYLGAPFSWRTLKAALAGKPIWELNHQFIVEWLAKHDPEAQRPVRDGKEAASGERPEPDESPESEQAKRTRLRSDDPVPDPE